ncbi:MAG: hypothetical protein HRU26_11240, partial [Psychroserpens sp.]|nr:hypothetical protein [Psychroserpens sp.]
MKNNFTFKSLFTAFALLFAVATFAQDRTCGMLEYMEEMLNDPVYKKQYDADQRKLKAEIAKRIAEGDYLNRGGSSIEIPVAVHFPTGNPADRACLEALAQNQIDILNADYTATNSDITLWAGASSNYPGLSPGAANITFCLATSNHPAAVPQLIEGQPAVTIGYNFANGSGFPEFDSNFSGYMNFLVKPIGGILGYSPLGGNVTAGGAVVINTNTFGSGSGCPASGIVPQFPYNQGRTTTHELGHFYGLNHPWGPAGPTCAQDDGFTDTPNTGQETYGCPNAGSQVSCGNVVLHMNYMDYVNDACMYMFTPQQMGQVNAYVGGVLQSQFNVGVCGPGTPGFNLTANNSPISSCPNLDMSVDFSISYTTIAGFNENTTFSATGVPAGATVSFTPGSLNTDGDVTMTIGNLGATAQGTYTITVTGTSNSVTESVDVVLENNCTQIVCDTVASAQNLNLA